MLYGLEREKPALSSRLTTSVLVTCLRSRKYLRAGGVTSSCIGSVWMDTRGRIGWTHTNREGTANFQGGRCERMAVYAAAAPRISVAMRTVRL